MEDHYLTVGELKRYLEDLPDSAKVYYERIEDAYFDQWDWKPDKIITTDGTYPSDNINDEYIRAFTAFIDDGGLYITAHF